jgi:hypothetical protein
LGPFYASDLEDVASAALTADEQFGRPVALRAWTDSNAILVIARCGPAAQSGHGRSRLAAVARLQHDIAAAFYLRSGELLRPCGRSADPQRRLLVLAFERMSADSLEASRGFEGRTPLADAR